MLSIRRSITTSIFTAIATSLVVSLALLGGCSKQSGSEEPTPLGQGSAAGQSGQAVGGEADGDNPEGMASAAGQSGYAVNPDGPPSAGDKAVDGTVETADGTELALSSAWQSGPAVVVFYRGHWCGYCQKQFKALAAEHDELANMGVTLVAVSAAREDPAEMQQKSGATFPLYVDPDLELIKSWGVFDSENEIAKPATFVIDADGTVAYAYVGADKADRPAWDEVKAKLAAM